MKRKTAKKRLVAKKEKALTAAELKRISAGFELLEKNLDQLRGVVDEARNGRFGWDTSYFPK